MIKYVNLNPNIRDIDDSGMVRGAQTIKPIPDVPSILDDENPPIPGIGLVPQRCGRLPWNITST